MLCKRARNARGVRHEYSKFDLFAALGTQFLSNACITSVTPVALLSAETRKSSSPLATSGGIAAATSIGMTISMACTYSRSARWLDGKVPYVLFAFLLMAGSCCYVLAEATHASVTVLAATRVAMSLGFGAIYCTKRRARCCDSASPALTARLAASQAAATGPGAPPPPPPGRAPWRPEDGRCSRPPPSVHAGAPRSSEIRSSGSTSSSSSSSPRAQARRRLQSAARPA